MAVDWNIVTAVAGVAAAGAAIVAIMIENHRSRRDHAIGMAFKMEEAFRSARMYEMRGRAARSALISPENIDMTAVDEVCGFYEVIAFYVREGAIPIHYVWFLFYNDAVYFYNTFKVYIDERRKTDPSIWEEYVKLCSQMEKLETTERRKKGWEKPSETNYESYLQSESLLLEWRGKNNEPRNGV